MDILLLLGLLLCGLICLLYGVCRVGGEAERDNKKFLKDD